MNKNWSSYGNLYLRSLNSHDRPKDSTTISTLSGQELQSALEAILEFVIHTNCGKAKIEIRHGRIDMSIESLKETL